MGKRLFKEILRKLIHLIGLPILAIFSFLHFYWSDRVGLLFLASLLLVLLKIEYFRLEYKIRLPGFFDLFRPREKDHMAGWIFFVSGMIIVFATFDFMIALTALLMTIFGDMVAALMGISFGKKKLFRKKTYVGTLSGLLANICVGIFLLAPYPEIFLPMALVATVMELFTNKLDDNLTMPLSAAFTGQAVAFALAINMTAMEHPLLNWLERLAG